MRKLLFTVFILCTFISLFGQNNQNDKNLVAYFPFNGNAKDASSSKLISKPFNVISTADITGKANGAYYFNGINSYIEVQNSSAINLSDSFTLSCWIAPELKQNQLSWISKSNQNTQWRFGFGDIASNEWGISHWNKDKVAYYTMVDSIPAKQWTFVAVTYNKKSKQVSLYKNGKLVESFETVIDFMGSDYPLFIGFYQEESLWFNGNIDEVKLFNKALTEKEINSQFKEFENKISNPLFPSKSLSLYSQNGNKDYFNQPEPDNIPVRFAPEYFGTMNSENSAPAFSPDKKEVYWSVIRREKDSVFQEIMFAKKDGDSWTKPKKASFSNGKLYEGCPFISNDGKKLYLYRGMPLFRYGFPANCKIVCYTREKDEWTNPQVIADGIYPSVSKNGTLYFNSRASQIIRIPFHDGKYGVPDTLKNIAFPKGRNTMPLIAPDESFLIFNRRNSSEIFGDFYISFFNKANNTWTLPLAIEKTNTILAENMPGLSPDRNYFFFVRSTSNSTPDIFWIKADFIDILKNEANKKK